MNQHQAIKSARPFFFSALAAALKPEERLSVSEWADKYRVVGGESGSPRPGKWSTDLVPYLREPMNCLHQDHPSRRITLKFSAQTGKSEIGVNWFAYMVDQTPSPMMIMLPSDNEALKYNKTKLQPAIDYTEKLKDKIKPVSSRDERSSTSTYKAFSGGFAQIVSASSSKGLQMVTIKYLIREEFKEYPLDVGGRGSPTDQARARQTAFGDDAKELAISTPGIDGHCPVTSDFLQGDQRRYYIPCPHCDMFQHLIFSRMQAPSPETSNKPTYACMGCGSLIEEHEKQNMLLRGQWLPTFENSDHHLVVPDVIKPDELPQYICPPSTGKCINKHPSYALWAAYSPLEPWSSIWAKHLDSQESTLKRKVFSQQTLGEAYVYETDAPETEAILEALIEYGQGVVPWPASVLTGAIDVQADRLEWGVWAYGPKGQGWLIAHGIIPYAPDQHEAWLALDEILERRFPGTEGQAIDVMQWGIDTGFMTGIIYEEVSKRPKLMALKGASGRQSRNAPPIENPKIIPLYDVEAMKRGNSPKSKYKKGRSIALYHIGSFALKFQIYQGFAALTRGKDEKGQYAAGTLFLPKWVTESYIAQLTAEMLYDPAAHATGAAKQARLERVGDTREWRKRPNQNNEALDIAVYCRALANYCGLDAHNDEIGAEQLFERARSIGQRPPNAPPVDLFNAYDQIIETTKPLNAAPPPQSLERGQLTRERFKNFGKKLNR